MAMHTLRLPLSLSEFPLLPDDESLREEMSLKQSNYEKLKQEGNQAFQNHKFGNAIKQYGLALEIDPYNAVLYSNRSAAYSEVENYVFAYKDACRCIRLRPEWTKGYFRKGIALQGLKQLKKAARCFEQAYALDGSNKEALERSRVCDSTAQQATSDFKTSEDDEFFCWLLSPSHNSLDIEVTADRGRGLFTSTDVSADRLLWKERPWFCYPKLREGVNPVGHICSHCCRALRTQSTLVCDRCDGAAGPWGLVGAKEEYCSHQCRAEAYVQYHRVLCAKATDLADFNRQHRDMRNVNMLNVIRYVACIVQDIQRERIDLTSELDQKNYDNGYFGVTWDYLKRLEFHDANSNTSAVAQVHRTISILLFTPSEGVFSSAEAELFRRFFTVEFIQRLYGIMFYNSLGVPLAGVYGVQQDFSEAPTGGGIYPIVTFCNHSCDPNLQVESSTESGDVVFIRTRRRIVAGEELTIAYIDINLPYEERQSQLRLKYNFACRCVRCSAEFERLS
eukprot:GILK01007874.1.p1 GENE.GILK01007874.1~~GILK01007874.1.p1  ORF type:complete len:518 (+),score=59.49 GILK01007874.1:37-1554(+)